MVKAQLRAGQAGKTALRAFGEVCGFEALNLSWNPKSGVLSTDGTNLTRSTTPPRPSPARGASRPLSSGVQAAGRFASLTAPQTRGLGRSRGIKGKGFARHRPPFGTRFAPFRVRPPVSPLTPLPLKNRAASEGPAK